jgi:hypothetical protein
MTWNKRNFPTARCIYAFSESSDKGVGRKLGGESIRSPSFKVPRLEK